MADERLVQLAVATSQATRRKPMALGRGLGALLGETRREEALVQDQAGESSTLSQPGSPPTSGLASVAVHAIEAHPDQPRRIFDEAALTDLAASIAARGVIQPVIVRPLGNGRYQLVAGERRWRAAQRAQLHEIPAIIRDLADRDVMALALIENLQREDLNPMEEARAYQRLADFESLTQAEIATMVDKSRSHVANIMRLLLLPDEVTVLVEQGTLSMGHARALIGVSNALVLARDAVARKLSVREIEKLVARETGGIRQRRKAVAARDPTDSADIAAVQGHLEELLGLTVRIKADSDPRSGSVTISYRSLDQLDMICQRLTGGGI